MVNVQIKLKSFTLAWIESSSSGPDESREGLNDIFGGLPDEPEVYVLKEFYQIRHISDHT